MQVSEISTNLFKRFQEKSKPIEISVERDTCKHLIVIINYKLSSKCRSKFTRSLNIMKYTQIECRANILIDTTITEPFGDCITNTYDLMT